MHLAFDLFPHRVAGRKVLVKPNVFRAAQSEECITTHPAVLEAMVACLEEVDPAQLVVGNNPGLISYGANEQSFEHAGLIAAPRGYCRNLGTEDVEMDSIRPIYPRPAYRGPRWRPMFFISVPKFKIHSLTVLTGGGIKNSYGILPRAQKALLHRPGRSASTSWW